MRPWARSTPRSSPWPRRFSDRGIVDGVQVNSVLPGPVMTGRRRSYLQHWAPLHSMTVEEATANFPKGAGIARHGEPEEIAELMAFLASPGARWMTGSTLRMDGGEVAGRIYDRVASRLNRERVFFDVTISSLAPISSASSLIGSRNATRWSLSSARIGCRRLSIRVAPTVARSIAFDL